MNTKDQAPLDDKAIADENDPIGADKSLLIVDDDGPFLRRLARAMETRGFNVDTAESVSEGIARDAQATTDEIEAALTLAAEALSAMERVGASVGEMNTRSAAVGTVAAGLAGNLNRFVKSVSDRLTA